MTVEEVFIDNPINHRMLVGVFSASPHVVPTPPEMGKMRAQYKKASAERDMYERCMNSRLEDDDLVFTHKSPILLGSCRWGHDNRYLWSVGCLESSAADYVPKDHYIVITEGQKIVREIYAITIELGPIDELLKSIDLTIHQLKAAAAYCRPISA